MAKCSLFYSKKYLLFHLEYGFRYRVFNMEMVYFKGVVLFFSKPNLLILFQTRNSPIPKYCRHYSSKLLIGYSRWAIKILQLQLYYWWSLLMNSKGNLHCTYFTYIFQKLVLDEALKSSKLTILLEICSDHLLLLRFDNIIIL